ncbi:MAG: adenylate/guanylate cyclase domain-containing protein, partial [Treponema sp.]|nr:adenylate/guanylate cyclase domain-containing protein [Treponema sp.]
QYRTGGVLISEYTKEKIGDKFICRSLDRVRVVGINTPLRIYELLGLRGEQDLRSGPGLQDAPDAGQAEYLAAWEQAIGLFEKGFFAQAGEIFSGLAKKMPQDNTAKLYVERCLTYAASLPEAWDGINNLTEK